VKEYKSLTFVIVAIFALLALGAYFSPTYSGQMGYMQGFLLAGALLFVASVVVIVAALGFHTFSLYIGVLASMAVAAFGAYGGFLVLFLTYLTWGFAFGIELLLVHNETQSALNWFKKYYTYRSFKREYYIFYPVLWILYFLLDVMPHFFYRDKIIEFRPQKILKKMEKILS